MAVYPDCINAIQIFGINVGGFPLISRDATYKYSYTWLVSHVGFSFSFQIIPLQNSLLLNFLYFLS